MRQRAARGRFPSSRVLAAALAEFVGSLARAGGLVAQFAAREREEHAFKARLLDDKPADACAEALQELFGEGIAARAQHNLLAVPARDLGMGGDDLGAGHL